MKCTLIFKRNLACTLYTYLKCYIIIQNYILFSEVSQYFSNIMEKESDISASIAAITTLLKLLEHDKCKYT